jgi:hypothetical protein
MFIPGLAPGDFTSGCVTAPATSAATAVLLYEATSQVTTAAARSSATVVQDHSAVSAVTTKPATSQASAYASTLAVSAVATAPATSAATASVEHTAVSALTTARATSQATADTGNATGTSAVTTRPATTAGTATVTYTAVSALRTAAARSSATASTGLVILAPEYDSAGAVASGSFGAGRTVPLPAVVEAGDLMIAQIGARAPDGACTADGPADWTAFDGNPFVAVGSVCREYLFYRLATGDEGGGTFTFTITGTPALGAEWLGRVYRYTGSFADPPIEAVASVTSAGGTIAAPTVTPLGTERLGVALTTMAPVYAWSADAGALPPAFTLARASAATYWTGGLLTFAAANAPRFEDIPGGKGLLLEGEFICLTPYSEQFGDAYGWAANGMVITFDVALDPTGAMAADQFEVAHGNYRYYGAPASILAGSPVAYSCYLQQGSPGGATHGRILTNNAVAVATGVAVKLALTSAWQRATGTYTQNGTNTATSAIGSLDFVQNIDPDCTGAARFWGINIGVGEFVTSYVRSDAGASVTRAPDFCSRTVTLPGAGFTETIEFTTGAGLPTAGETVEHFSGGGNDIRLVIEGGTLKLRCTGVADLAIGSIAAATRYRVAYTVSTTRRAASLDGAAAVSGAGVAAVTATTQALGSETGGGSSFFGHLIECNHLAAAWATPASDAELQSLAAAVPAADGSFTGETGGDWTESVDPVRNVDLLLQAQDANLGDGSEISGGSFTPGVSSTTVTVGFALVAGLPAAGGGWEPRYPWFGMGMGHGIGA